MSCTWCSGCWIRSGDSCSSPSGSRCFFPQIARFEQKTLLILKNSILISISNIVLTIAVLAVSFFAVDLCLHNGDWLVLIVSIYLFIGFALTGKVFSFYLRSVFRKIEDGEQKRS